MPSSAPKTPTPPCPAQGTPPRATLRRRPVGACAVFALSWMLPVGLLASGAVGLAVIGCGAFASVSSDAPFVSLQPNYAYQGDKRSLLLHFPALPANTVAQSHFTELDFGNQILPSEPEFGVDGTIRIRVEVTRSAGVGERFVRVGIATPAGEQYEAAAIFHVLRPAQ